MVASGRFEAKDAPSYIIAQLPGGVAAASIFAIILSGAISGGGIKWNTFTAISHTFGGPGKFTLISALLIEIVITALFLIIIMGATSAKAPVNFAPIAIGLSLLLFHLVSIPVSNASVNPARATATARFCQQQGARPAVGILDRANYRWRDRWPSWSLATRRIVGEMQ